MEELMSAIAINPVVGLKDSDAYIINYKQNNVFSDDLKDTTYGIIDGKLNTVVFVDNKDNKLKKEAFDIERLYGNKAYRVGTVEEVSKRIWLDIDKEVNDNNYIYKAVFDIDPYTDDEVYAMANETVISIPKAERINKLEYALENAIGYYNELYILNNLLEER